MQTICFSIFVLASSFKALSPTGMDVIVSATDVTGLPAEI